MLKCFGKAAVILGLLSMGACGTLTPNQQSTVTGGAVGMAAGTVSTVILGGCIPCGTAIGGAIGAGTGYAIEQFNQQIAR